METGGEPALYDQPAPCRLSPGRFTGTLKDKTHLLLSFCWILADSVFFPGFSATVLGDDSGSATATEGFTASFSSFGCSGTELALSLSVNKPFKKNKHWAFRWNDNLESTWLALCTKNTHNTAHHVFRDLDWPSCTRHGKKKGMLKFLGDFPWFCCSWCQAMCAAAVKTLWKRTGRQWQEITSGVGGCWEGHNIVPGPFWECWENRLAASLGKGKQHWNDSSLIYDQQQKAQGPHCC